MWNIKLPEPKELNNREQEILSASCYKEVLNSSYESYETYKAIPEIAAVLNLHPEFEPYLYASYQVEKYNYGKRTGITRNGSKAEQFRGIYAQVILADYLKQPRPDGSSGYDNGVDFVINGANVDLKCMGRNVYIEQQYVHNLLKSQVEDKNSKTDFYIFCSFNQADNVLQVCGCCQKRLIDKCSFLRTRATPRANDIVFKADTFEVSQNELFPIHKLEDIYKKIYIEALDKPLSDSQIRYCLMYHKCETFIEDMDIKVNEDNGCMTLQESYVYDRAKAFIKNINDKKMEYINKFSSVSDYASDMHFINSVDLDCKIKEARNVKMNSILHKAKQAYNRHNER